jgi:hypothetical protein
MRKSRMRSYTALVDYGHRVGQDMLQGWEQTLCLLLRQLTWKVPRLSSRSASIDHTFSDLYTRFCTGSELSKYSARRAGSAVAFCGEDDVKETLKGCPSPTAHLTAPTPHLKLALTRSSLKASS